MVVVDSWGFGPANLLLSTLLDFNGQVRGNGVIDDRPVSSVSRQISLHARLPLCLSFSSGFKCVHSPVNR